MEKKEKDVKCQSVMKKRVGVRELERISGREREIKKMRDEKERKIENAGWRKRKKVEENAREKKIKKMNEERMKKMLISKRVSAARSAYLLRLRTIQNEKRPVRTFR